MQEVDRCIELSREAAVSYKALGLAGVPAAVDHSKHISFVRHQGAYGCGMNAAAACVDILWTMNCPPHFHPNVSVNRMLWAWRWPLQCLPEDKPCSQRAPGRIPGLGGTTYEFLDEYLSHFGFATEGTELTNSDGVQWPTDAGNAECPHYRLAKHFLNLVPTGDPAHPAIWLKEYPHSLKVDMDELKYWLNGGPVRIGVWGKHFVTLVGYDDSTGRFKYLNSWGDRWGEGGFCYIDYADLHKEVDSAQVYMVEAPTPLPCARIGFKSERRQNVYLWLSVDGKPYVKRIWPSGQRQDDSRNLSLTVTLPAGFTWPPSPQNQLCLDVYDCGSGLFSGGRITEFTVGQQGQYYYSGDIQQGPVAGGAIPAGAELLPGERWSIPVPFAGRTMLRLTVP